MYNVATVFFLLTDTAAPPKVKVIDSSKGMAFVDCGNKSLTFILTDPGPAQVANPNLSH